MRNVHVATEVYVSQMNVAEWDVTSAEDTLNEAQPLYKSDYKKGFNRKQKL
jgi:hypothetical protein